MKQTGTVSQYVDYLGKLEPKQLRRFEFNGNVEWVTPVEIIDRLKSAPQDSEVSWEEVHN